MIQNTILNLEVPFPFLNKGSKGYLVDFSNKIQGIFYKQQSDLSKRCMERLSAQIQENDQENLKAYKKRIYLFRSFLHIS